MTMTTAFTDVYMSPASSPPAAPRPTSPPTNSATARWRTEIPTAC